MEEREHCSVANDNCVNPAGYGTYGGYSEEPRRTRVRCAYCGEAVCRNCHTKVDGAWYCTTHFEEGDLVWLMRW